MSMIDQTLDKINQEPEPRPTFLGKIVDQITHFFKDTRNSLQIEHTTPTLVKNYPHDGNITVRLLKEGSSQAFKLNISEALRIAKVLNDLCELHISLNKNLWEESEQLRR